MKTTSHYVGMDHVVPTDDFGIDSSIKHKLASNLL